MRRSVSLIVGLLLAITGLVGLASSASAAGVKDGDLVTSGTPFTMDLPAGGSLSVRFNATAGQHLALWKTTAAPTALSYSLTGPGGVTLPVDLGDGGYVESGVVPATGVWTFRAASGVTVSVPMLLNLATDTTAALTLGTSTTATTKLGQNAKYTFAATAGQKFHVDVTALDLGGGAALVSLLRPDGSTVEIPVETSRDQPYQGDAELDRTGTWTLVVDPAGGVVGRTTFKATKPVDTVVPVTPGTARTVTYPSGGSDVRLTFSATAGQRVTLGVTAFSLTAPSGLAASVRERLIGPDGVERGDLGEPFRDTTFLSDTQHVLDRTGTWTVLLDAQGPTTGTLTVKVGLVTDGTGALKFGVPTSVDLGVPGRQLTYTVPVTGGKPLIFELRNATVTGGSSGGNPATAFVDGTLYGPDGSFVHGFDENGSLFGEVNESVTGTYKLVISGYSDTVVSGDLVVRNPTVTTAALPLNTSSTVAFTPGNDRRYTFTGVKGRRLTLSFTALTITPENRATLVHLVGPDGTAYEPQTIDFRNLFFESAPLPSAGAWSVVIDPQGAATGSYAFTPRLTADQVVALTPGTAVTSRITLPGQQVRYTFAGTKGRRIAVDVSATSWKSPTEPGADNFGTLSLVRPNGTVAAQLLPTAGTNFRAGRDWAEPFGLDTLDATGTWTLVVDPLGDRVGTQSLKLLQITDQTGTLTRGTAKKVTISTAGQRAVYSVSWNGKGSLPWSVTGSTFANASLTFISPDGRSRVDQVGFAAGSASGSFSGDDENGTWKLVVDGNQWNTGSLSVKLG